MRDGISFLWLPFWVSLYLPLRDTKCHQQNSNRCFQSRVIEFKVEGHEGRYFSIMIPMASILGQFVPTPERYKMPSNRCFQSRVIELRVEGHEGRYFSIMIPMASIMGQFLPTPIGTKCHQQI